MAVLDTDEVISVTEASDLGVSKLVRVAEDGSRRFIFRNNRPVAVVLGMDEYEAVQHTQDDLEDLALAAARMLTASDKRIPLSEILDQYGFSREELLALAEE